MTDPTPQPLPTNRLAVISLIAAVLVMFSVCGAVVPIPLTGYVCYPAAGLLGFPAFITGLVSLRQLRSTRARGQAFAWIGTAVGGLAILADLCAIAAAILLWPQISAFLHQFIK